MTTFAIGDIHGCLPSLEELLRQIPTDAKLLFIGDIVNRGPQSLATIRKVMSFGKRAECLLGNHEIHLMAVYAGKRALGKGDTIQEVLDAPDCDEIIEWLRHRPMALFKHNYLMVHAACDWRWSLDDTLKYARKVEKFFRSDKWRDEIGEIFGRQQWDKSLKGKKKLRAIVNVLTRTRFLNPDGSMDFKQKWSPSETPKEYIPWFEYPGRKTADTKIVFGHWSTLGSTSWPNIFPLDTGCLWGGKLTALRLNKHPMYLSVKAPLYVKPWQYSADTNTYKKKVGEAE